jgi:hypothetical protein
MIATFEPKGPRNHIPIDKLAFGAGITAGAHAGFVFAFGEPPLELILAFSALLYVAVELLLSCARD